MLPTASRTIVVGASSGIGAALVERLARRGDPVVALARRGSELTAVATRVRAAHPLAQITTIAHDVTDPGSAAAAFASAVQALGGLDRIIYAAGVMPKVGLDEFSILKDAEIVAVNVTGAMAWLDLAAAHFLRQRSGQIVGISSIAGERGRLGNPAYCASKAALTTFLEALRNRLTRHGISVVTVKPGFIQTDMLKGVEKLFWVISPERCAEIIMAGCDRKAQSFFVPWRWSLVALAVRSFPSFIFRRLNV